MLKKLTPLQRKKLIASLSKKRVTNVSYHRGYLNGKFDGHPLKDKVEMKHDPGLGNWSRRHRKIFYDERVQKTDLLPVLVHEAVEKYVTQHYHMRTQSEAHLVAMAVEKKFVADACSRRYRERCTHSGRCWRKHEQRLQGAWLAENVNNKKHRHKPAKKRQKSKK